MLVASGAGAGVSVGAAGGWVAADVPVGAAAADALAVVAAVPAAVGVSVFELLLPPHAASATAANGAATASAMILPVRALMLVALR